VSTRRRLALLAIVPGAWLVAFGVAHGRVARDDAVPSRSIGTPAQGRLEHGHPIPPSGSGFVTYSYLGSALGRQYVHGAVRDLLVEVFAACARDRPDRRFIVGETGWPQGGRFWPHKSHENGLSVDVFMPLRDETGRARDVTTWPWKKFGYGLEFDVEGKLGDLSIDFDELALLLTEIDARAPAFGLRVQQIIVAPEYVPLILATPSGKKMGRLSAALLRRPVWWRHDEHVHVDFATQRPGSP
jgi:penicillin-insensitive murein endopeptidase